MSERLFVIMEVKELDRPEDFNEHTRLYCPGDSASTSGVDYSGERLFLKPSRIIPASRLRYGTCKKGDTYFAGGWVEWQGADMINPDLLHRERLILDPAPEAKDKWEEWCKDFATAIRHAKHPGMAGGGGWDHVLDTLKRMPRKE